MHELNTAPQKKPTIYWILQKNHVTPFIVDFLNFYRSSAPNVNFRFLIPSIWEETIEQAEKLNPEVFKVIVREERTYEWYHRKRDAMKDIRFKDGLHAWRALLADDLHGGQVRLLAPQLPEDPHLQFIMMQVPIPLGSFSNEEGIFHASFQWARQRKIPVIGYELLPLDTKWNLAQSLLDGIITTSERTYDWLTSDRTKITPPIWLLPKYEANFFSVASTYFWRNSLGTPHNFQVENRIPNDKAVVYVPHNVAMSHEYRILIHELSKRGKDLHLMISIGDDQIRGTHNHQQIVEILNKADLEGFHSYSFSDLNAHKDLACVDGVIACSSCHLSEIASLHTIPTYIIDPDVAGGRYGNTTVVNAYDDLDAIISRIVGSHQKTSKLGDIFSHILNTTMNPSKKRNMNDEYRL